MGSRVVVVFGTSCNEPPLPSSSSTATAAVTRPRTQRVISRRIVEARGGRGAVQHC